MGVLVLRGMVAVRVVVVVMAIAIDRAIKLQYILWGLTGIAEGIDVSFRRSVSQLIRLVEWSVGLSGWLGGRSVGWLVGLVVGLFGYEIGLRWAIGEVNRSVS